MATKNRRQRSGNSIQDPNSLQSLMYDIFSNAQRNSEVGAPISKIVGPLTAAVRVGRGQSIRIWNDTGATLYFVFGATSGMAAPTGAADGVAVPANSYILTCSLEDEWVRASAIGLFGYEIGSDSRLIEVDDAL